MGCHFLLLTEQEVCQTCAEQEYTSFAWSPNLINAVTFVMIVIVDGLVNLHKQMEKLGVESRYSIQFNPGFGSNAHTLTSFYIFPTFDFSSVQSVES